MDFPSLCSSHISVIWIHECAKCPFFLCMEPCPSLFPAQVLGHPEDSAYCHCLRKPGSPKPGEILLSYTLDSSHLLQWQFVNCVILSPSPDDGLQMPL